MTERQGAGRAHEEGTSKADWAAAFERRPLKSDQDIAAAMQHLQARFKKHGEGVLRRVDAVDVLWFLCGKKNTAPNDKESIKKLIGLIAAGDEAHLLAAEVRDALQLGLRHGKPFKDQYQMYRKRLDPSSRRPLEPLNSTHPAPLEATCARCGVKPDPYPGARHAFSCTIGETVSTQGYTQGYTDAPPTP